MHQYFLYCSIILNKRNNSHFAATFWTQKRADIINFLDKPCPVLGNGYMGVGGYDEEENKEAKHELNTFIAGIFVYYMPGKTDMVNTPNYWRTDIWINGERFSHGYGKIVEFYKELNMKEGILRRKLVWENNQGNKTLVETTKFLCIDSVHNAIMSIKLSPVNYSGNITIETGIDADIWNCIIDDDQMKTDANVSRFLAEDGSSVYIDDIHLIRLKTVGTDFKIYEGFTTEVLHKGNKLSVGHSVLTRTDYVDATVLRRKHGMSS